MLFVYCLFNLYKNQNVKTSRGFTESYIVKCFLGQANDFLEFSLVAWPHGDNKTQVTGPAKK